MEHTYKDKKYLIVYCKERDKTFIFQIQENKFKVDYLGEEEYYDDYIFIDWISGNYDIGDKRSENYNDKEYAIKTLNDYIEYKIRRSE